jgi:type IV pilus assembly protein PilX
MLTLSVLLLGVAVMGVNVMQERIVGNARDKDLALQAAEAALRDAELDVANNITSATGFSSDCTDGLCMPPSQRATPDPRPVHQQDGWSWADAGKVRRLGQYTGAPAFPGASTAAPPVYVIEKLGVLGAPSGESMALGAEASAPGQAYRITARAVGARPETEVILQSIYATR